MSKRKYFGTDGIRGLANTSPMTGEVAMALGRAVTHYFQRNDGPGSPMVIIGKDTRLSCYMLEQAFAAGVCSQGGRAVLTGPLPTPGVAFATLSMRADCGVMISASHNSFEDNGIKIFDRYGNKLADSVERELERLIENPQELPTLTGDQLGNTKRLDEVIGRYIVHVKAAFPSSKDLSGLRLVVDGANGAAYRVAPLVFEELGAEVVRLGNSPDGTNINRECGALYPDSCARAVQDYRADLGVCLDGDADRIVMVDEKGKVVPGDVLIGLLARELHKNGQLRGPVIGTVMSNMGLEIFLQGLGVGLDRTSVGDRYILERMRQSGANFGGEPSGHVIFRNHSTTGDGLLAALKVLELVSSSGRSLHDLAGDVQLLPQHLLNVNVVRKTPFEELPAVEKHLKKVETSLGQTGRVVLRYSGTEPKVRIMIEGKDQDQIEDLASDLGETLKKDLT